MKIIGGKQLQSAATSAVNVNSIFVDSSDNAIKLKDNSGSIITL